MTTWTFEDFGPEFDTHVAAHLPGYADVQRLVQLVASFSVPMGGVVADLGCSTGATAAHIAYLGRHAKFHMYDNDESMLRVAEHRLTDEDANFYNTALPAGFAHSDADLTVALWLLQFIPQNQWRSILAMARYRSKPSGCILVAAKTRHADPRWEEIAVAALDDYKDEAGVSEKERIDKARSLRGALHQVTPASLSACLLASGWYSPTVLWKWHVWTIIGAWASPIQSEGSGGRTMPLEV